MTPTANTYANTAAFDAIVACFENKFRYWFIRPSRADIAITTSIGLPNHHHIHLRIHSNQALFVSF